MTTFKIATWNVNSLRVRLEHLLKWIESVQPDVIALQEIKLVDEDFPQEIIRNTGYVAICSGQKSYNGVAVLSRNTIADPLMAIPNLDDPQRRILAVTIGDVRVVNLYIPNGQSVGSEKYAYKLNWLENLLRFLKEEMKRYPRMIILGDFNIAPQDEDVHDPLVWEGKVMCSTAERQAFQDILALGFKDCYRLYSSAKEYTWWDYRLYAFKRNLGLRIDHILASEGLSPQCVACVIDKVPRAWERPTDHAPVHATFDFSLSTH